MKRKLKKLGTRLIDWSCKQKYLGGKGMFHILCLECDDIYHRSHTNELGEAHAHFLRSRINSHCHLEAYEERLDLVDVSKVNHDVEDTVQANKINVANAT